MGQYWMFVCMDTRQATGHLGKLGNIVFGGPPEYYLYEHLAVPNSFPQDLPPLSPIKKIGPNKPSTFEELPGEIIEHIFESLGSFENMLTLALSSYRFLELSRTCILKHFKATISPWAGKRLICAGDYARSHPKDFLTKEELEELKGVNLYIFGAYGYLDVIPSIRKVALGDFGSVDKYAKGANKDKIANKLIEECKTENFFSGKPNVLRNLVTKEYITKEDVEQHTGSYTFDICTVLMFQICWSDDLGLLQGTDLGEKLFKGRWAGQRFDITTADKVNETWANISKKATKFVCRVFDYWDVGPY